MYYLFTKVIAQNSIMKLIITEIMTNSEQLRLLWLYRLEDFILSWIK